MEEKIKYELSVDNRYVRSVKGSIEDDGLKIIDKFSMPDCGTCLIIEGTLEEIKEWCMWNEFDFNPINIVK